MHSFPAYGILSGQIARLYPRQVWLFPSLIKDCLLSTYDSNVFFDMHFKQIHKKHDLVNPGKSKQLPIWIFAENSL